MPLAKHLSSGTLTNTTIDPLGSRAELDVDSKDEKDPSPSRIVFRKKEKEFQGHRALGATTVVDVTLEPGSGFDPLKTLLGNISAAYADRKGTTSVRNKVEVLVPRITSLHALFATPPGDVEDMRDRNELIREIKGIERQLKPLYGKPEQVVDRGQDDEVVFRLLEDLQEVVFHYQMARRTAIDDRAPKPMDQAEAAVLNSFRQAQQAEYRHCNHDGCLKGTRSAVLDGIELWTCDPYKPSVYWLNGLAGTGKSTIARTIAERMFAAGRLGASFFCSRDFEDRSDLKLIFPTLAVQLARSYPEFRSIFVPLVQSDPGIAHELPYGQMNKLIVQPLVKSGISTVIVIDALDECKDDEPASAILSVLGRLVQKIPKAKFLVTGRPEPRIQEGFRLLLLAEATDVFVLHEVKPSRVNSDIRAFFRHKFSELKGRRRVVDDWPTEGQLDLLCERAAGFFVYAVATIRFIDQKNKNPRRQLDRLLESLESGFEGKTKLKADLTLDSLYMSILQEAFGDDDPEDDSDVRSVLGAVVLATNPLSPSAIAALLGLDPGDVYPLLSSVRSLLVLREDIDQPVRAFHKSFPDFIVDLARCANTRFHVCPSDEHANLLVGCLELMNQSLKRNMCKLPDGVINSEVDDLEQRKEQWIDSALEYACKSWHKHLIGKVMTARTLDILQRFLMKKFLFWLEILSILGAVREAVDALETIMKWLDVPSILELARDYSRFVIAFFDLISASAPHIYISALPLSPRTSIVRNVYKRYECPLARVVRGLSTSWEVVVATVFSNQPRGAVAWSPCSRFIAVITSGAVEIHDAVTLSLLNIFESPQGHYIQTLGFSPDGRFLTKFSNSGFVTWDLRTGGSISNDTIPTEGMHLDPTNFSSSYSTDGKMLAVVYSDEDFENPSHFIVTHDSSTTHAHLYRVSEGRLIPPIWTHGEFLRFTTIKPGSITIWEVDFTLTQTPEVVESLPAPEEIADVGKLKESLFLPTLSRLAMAFQYELLVWDARNSKLLLKPWTSHPSGMSFSSDGHYFAFGDFYNVHVWKESPAGYVLHQQLAGAVCGGPRLSPNGQSIVVSLSSTIHLWHTKDPVLSDDPFLSANTSNFFLAFSPDMTLAAFARPLGNTVVILDLQSGNPRLEIDMVWPVESMGVGESTIAVVCGKTIFTWDLAVGQVRATIEDSVRSTQLDPSSHAARSLTSSSSLSPDLSRIVILGFTKKPVCVEIYDVLTGRCLAGAAFRPGEDVLKPWFTPDGREIWGGPYENSSVNRWEIIDDGESGTTELQPLGVTPCPPGVLPWESSCGYEVTDDWWIMSPAQRRLLWLPHRWRSVERGRRWSGRFLGFPHDELPEVVILEFFE